MSNFRRGQFEWPLEQPEGGRFPGLVLTASFDTGYSGVGQYVSFGAEQRGLCFFPKSRDKAVNALQGAEYRKQLPGPTYYARDLERDDEEWALGGWIRAIGRDELGGRAAADAVWTIFFRLVLRRDGDWVRELGNDWLTGLIRGVEVPS